MALSRILLAAAVFLPSVIAHEPGSGDDAPLEPVRESITITATPLGPTIDPRNGEIFRKHLFSRDDQILQVLDAGISAGQHEGGGKSLEIRRFGYNLDHGGAAGGLRITVDNVPQNHGTQGHGQGYLGSLKSLTPELVEDVTLINGPFSAEQGDFSGLGSVQIRLRETMPDLWTVRLQGGQYGTRRGFLSWSPRAHSADGLIAYDGSLSDGPFVRPLDYERHNITGAYTRRLDDQSRFGLKWSGGLNRFNSSGQIPLDEVFAGRLPRYGNLGFGDGGRVQQGRFGVYYSRDFEHGSQLKADSFIERSLFDLYSNFTFFLNDPIRGDCIQQHDSRLSEGGSLQFIRPQLFAGGSGELRLGAAALVSSNLVDLRRTANRDPFELQTSAHARVSNGSGYLQQSLDLVGGHVQVTGGLRWDVFRYDIHDRLEPAVSGAESAAPLQPKATIAVRPSDRLPLRMFVNYGRGVSSLDGRGVVRRPDGPRVATTDFTQFGLQTWSGGRWMMSADLFHIQASHQLVYVPDDGTLQLADPSRSYGFEARTSARITRKLSFNAGVTKVLNGYYRGAAPRVYLDRAPRFTANAGLTVSDWRGWSASLRGRAINHYRLDGLDSTILAAGHAVVDFAVSRPLAPTVELGLAVDNLTNRQYWETQNYFVSQLGGQGPRERIHGTPAYGRTIVVGATFRFGRR